MLQTYALALAMFAVLLTAAWLFIPIRITFTSLLSFISWGFLSLVGGDVEKHAMDGSLVAAPVSNELRWFLALLALLSLLAAILHRFGAFPPEEQEQDLDENHSHVN